MKFTYQLIIQAKGILNLDSTFSVLISILVVIVRDWEEFDLLTQNNDGYKQICSDSQIKKISI